MEKSWFISREQSYHGATTDALALGDRPNLKFYKELFSKNRKKIPMHHPLKSKMVNKSEDEYAERSCGDLEKAIIEIGPEKVCAFVGETIMGGLVGDVPPAKLYWQKIKKICDKYNVHLILDEIYCGTGSSGRYFCCDWDEVKPDFILLGKTLAAGYGALSAIVTRDDFQNCIEKGQGRLQVTSTHQAHALSVAAALAVQKKIIQQNLSQNANLLGLKMRQYIFDNLKQDERFVNVRGRGLRFAVEHSTINNNKFSNKISSEMRKKHKIFISSKWHRPRSLLL